MLKKYIKNLYKNYIKLTEYSEKKILNGEEGNLIIKESLLKNNPLMVTRIGSTELEVLSAYVYNNKKYSDYLRNKIQLLSGVFPTDDNTLNKFCEIFLDSLSESDIIGVWFNKNEGKIINKYCRNVNLVELRSIEPYYWSNPWSEALEGKKVLVIHPFEDSIKKQYEKRATLFKDKNILPEFTLKTIKAVQSAAGNRPNFDSWVHALDYMCKEIDKVDFDIAIIGAGAYGLPLAAYVKRKGKLAIHMGGASQILFGIKGKRWDSHSFISKLYNDNWIRPSKAETYEKSDQVEGGCYW